MKHTEKYRKRIKMAKMIIRSSKNTSTSYLQRKMRIGYNSADMLMDDISKLREFQFLYIARRKLILGLPIRKKEYSKLFKRVFKYIY